MIKFDSIGVYEITGRGRVYTVELERDMKDVDVFVGREVLIDGRFWKVNGVERFAHAPPWRKGEPIGLKVETLREVSHEVRGPR